jgi:hypothetical protein
VCQEKKVRLYPKITQRLLKISLSSYCIEMTLEVILRKYQGLGDGNRENM